MMVGARAALALKMGAGTFATLAVVGLGLAFWPSMKIGRIAAKSAVEQPVFIVASAPKTAPPSAPTTVAATPMPAPSPDKSSLAQLASALKTQAPKMAAAAPAAPQPVAAPQAPSAPTNATRDAEGCFSHGLLALAKGDISAARRWLEQAADEGENRAFMVLGDAYNPAMLTRLGVLGAPGDAALARDYYNRAVAAGLTGARERLASLEPAN